VTSRSDADLVKRLKAFVSIAAVFSMVFGLSGLVGWALNLPALVTWGDGTAMAPNAAACFLLAGLSLLLLGEKDKQQRFAQIQKLIARTSAATVGLVGLLTLMEQMFGRNLGIDRLLLLRSPGPPIAAAQIVMSAVAAGAFLLLSLALLLIDWRTRGEKWPAQFICLAAALAPVFGVLGWILGPGSPPITLAWPAVVVFAMLTTALLCSRAPWAMGGVLTRQRPGAKMLRGAFPAVLLVLCVLGWLLSKPLLSGVHFTWAEVTVLAIVTGSMIAGFVGWTTFIVDRSDRERKRLEEALQLRQEHLDQLLNAVEEPETEARLRKLVKAGVAGAALLTGLLGVLSWRMAIQAGEDADWIALAHEVSATLELTLRHLTDVETGARGFALTGHEPFLEPYNSGNYGVTLDLQKLRTLIVEPDQVRRLDVLVKQVKLRLEEAADLVAARRQSSETPAIVRLMRGKQAMDAVGSTIQEMEDQEIVLLEQRTQRARGTRRFTSSAIGLGSILGIIFLSIAGLTVSREIRVAARAQGQVKALNADLERRVEQRTAALQSEMAVRKRTEEMRERLAAIVESSDDAIISKTPEGMISAWNRGAEKVFGYSAAEIVGKPMLVLLPPERIDEESDILARIKRGENVEHFETVRIRKDGTRIDVSVTSSPIRDGSGAIVGASKVARDITRRKQAEEALGAQTSMLKLVLESMGEGLIAADREGHFLLWNDAADTLMGRGATDIPTEQWTPHYKVFLSDGITPCPPDRLPLVRALHGELVKVELMVQPPEPQPGKFIEVTARPLKDPEGNLRGGVAVLHDITEQKRSAANLARQAEELRHSQQALETETFMLQSVLNSMVEGLVAADEHGKFILWNAAAGRIIGLGAANVPSNEWGAHYGLFLPDTVTPIPPGETPLERTLRGETGTAEIFLRHAGVNPGLWLETNGSPLIDKDGMVRGGVLAFRDITRRKADELEIRKLNEDLEERIAKRTEQLAAANDELEAFSYSVSHDLRAPLRHIAGFSRILVNNFGPAMAVEEREYLQFIEDAVRRMGLLVEGLLSLARLGQQSLKLCGTELNAIVDDVISILEPECEGREVEWRVARLPALDCDPILMAQVFQNLLGNALKYSRGRASAVIEVGSIEQPGKPAIIFVRDNGAGFNQKYAAKLFGVFQRFHTDTEFEGTGVGLATVHRIIRKHGGTIWAESEPDHGATFFFALHTTDQIGTKPKAKAAS
jgi:PAS domain S-box-containing protein